MDILGSYVRYMFHVPNIPNWTVYRYQKLFRLLYGYTQVVSKGSGSTYVYYREGVLTSIPYIKAGKNAVIVPQDKLSVLTNFFKKGLSSGFKHAESDWKVTYYVETMRLTPEQVSGAFDALFDRFKDKTGLPLDVKFHAAVEQGYIDEHILSMLPVAQNIVKSSWFDIALKNSLRVQKFYTGFNAIKAQNS